MENIRTLEGRVIDVVREAVALVKNTNFSVSEKGDVTDIVTTNDILSQNFLIDRLGRLIPGSGFHSEEGVCDKNKEYVWIIDPIDGTANYSRGISDCAISVALARGGRVVLGVVCSIGSGDVYSATLGGGARLNGSEIFTSKKDFASSMLCTAMSLYRKEYAKLCSDIIFDIYMRSNDLRRFGSCALELCYIAAGRCELYFEMRVFPWDHAAGGLILQEAGGMVSGLEGAPLLFDRTTPVIAANNAQNHEKLCKIIKKHVPCVPYEEIL
jgi:myo-inositol-1(or 4)-monophosphatase